MKMKRNPYKNFLPNIWMKLKMNPFYEGEHKSKNFFSSNRSKFNIEPRT